MKNTTRFKLRKKKSGKQLSELDINYISIKLCHLNSLIHQ